MLLEGKMGNTNKSVQKFTRWASVNQSAAISLPETEMEVLYLYTALALQVRIWPGLPYLQRLQQQRFFALRWHLWSGKKLRICKCMQVTLDQKCAEMQSRASAPLCQGLREGGIRPSPNSVKRQGTALGLQLQHARWDLQRSLAISWLSGLCPKYNIPEISLLIAYSAVRAAT